MVSTGCSIQTDNSDDSALINENNDLKAKNVQLNKTISQLQVQVEDLQSTVDKLQDENVLELSTPNDATLIKATKIDPSGSKPWTSLSNFHFDYDLDGQEENLTLFTSAMRDDKGTIMWDDGQNWLLMIQDGTSFYSLFLKYVQLGSVFFTVTKQDENLIPTISIVVTTSTPLNITDIKYNIEEEAYQAFTVYDSGVLNRFFTSMPDYK